MVPAEVAVVRSLADVSEAFIRIAQELRRRPDVREAHTECHLRAEDKVEDDHFRVGTGAGFRMEWYATAELANQSGLTFCLDVAWHDGEWTVDSSVRTMIDDEDTAILELPRRYAIESDDATAEIQGQARMLEDSYNDAMLKFQQLTSISIPQKNTRLRSPRSARRALQLIKRR